jgi:hypothetical protein
MAFAATTSWTCETLIFSAVESGGRNKATDFISNFSGAPLCFLVGAGARREVIE